MINKKFRLTPPQKQGFWGIFKELICLTLICILLFSVFYGMLWVASSDDSLAEPVKIDATYNFLLEDDM